MTVPEEELRLHSEAKGAPCSLSPPDLEILEGGGCCFPPSRLGEDRSVL